MNRIIRSRPSPAIIVAVVALVAALAGTAVAGPGASSSAITKSKVKTIANKQADKAIDNVLPLGSANLGTITTRTSTQTVNVNTSANTTANCQAGERVLSGGVAGGAQLVVVEADRKQGEGWFGSVFNAGANNSNFTVEAYCLAP
jgi:hypothetical protein